MSVESMPGARSKPGNTGVSGVVDWGAGGPPPGPAGPAGGGASAGGAWLANPAAAGGAQGSNAATWAQPGIENVYGAGRAGFNPGAGFGNQNNIRGWQSGDVARFSGQDWVREGNWYVPKTFADSIKNDFNNPANEQALINSGRVKMAQAQTQQTVAAREQNVVNQVGPEGYGRRKMAYRALAHTPPEQLMNFSWYSPTYKKQISFRDILSGDVSQTLMNIKNSVADVPQEEIEAMLQALGQGGGQQQQPAGNFQGLPQLADGAVVEGTETSWNPNTKRWDTRKTVKGDPSKKDFHSSAAGLGSYKPKKKHWDGKKWVYEDDKPKLAAGGVVDQRPGGTRVNINGRDAIVGEGGQPEAVLPLDVLHQTVAAAAEHGARRGAGMHSMAPGMAGTMPQPPPGPETTPRLAEGGVVNPFFNPNGDPPRYAPGGQPLPPFKWGAGPMDSDPQDNYRKLQPPPRQGYGTQFTPLGVPQMPDPSQFGGTSYAGNVSYTPERYSPYQERQMSQEEQNQLSAITGLAKLLQGQGKGMYDVGSGAYGKAVQYYQTLLGGNRAAMTSAVAPTAEAIREQGAGAADATRNALGRSGAADAAIANQNRTTAGQIAEVTRGVQPGAAQALGALGTQGAQIGGALEQAGGGLDQAALQSLTQHRQFEEGMGESSRQFSHGQYQQGQQFGTQLQVQQEQFGAQLAEQVRQGNLSAAQAQQALAFQNQWNNQNYSLQLKQFDESIRQFNQQMQLQGQQLKAQQKAAKWGGMGSLLGQGLRFIPGYQA